MEFQLKSEWVLMGAASLALVFMLVAFFLFRAWIKARVKAAQLQVELGSATQYAEERIAALEGECDEAIEAKEAAEAAKTEAEKQASLMEQRLADMRERMKDWESHREEQLKHTKATVMEVGQKLSSKLLEDHKREQEQAKKEQEKLAQQTTKNLMENFEKLNKSVTALESRTTSNSRQVETMMRAMTHPAGAGYLSEVGLENSLKHLGLEAGRDFIMQYHASGDDGSSFRPDAVIFLPQDMVMVIDSKASKFIVELAEAEGTEEEAALLKQLLATMHGHIDALARKSYRDAVASMLKKQGRAFGRMLNVMYLPSEAAIEKLRKADAAITSKCEKHDIILAGPASLHGLFSLANQQISAAKRDAHQQEIIALLRDVMGSFATALTHVDGVGKNIQQAAKKFDQFAKSINSRLLPKLRSIQSLGVEPAKNKALPQSIKSFDVLERDDVVTAEAIETEDVLQLEAKKRTS